MLLTLSLTTVLLVGWDGADYRIVRRLHAEGQLPNLARVGKPHEMRILERTETKPSWPTILSSGLPWYVHGTRSNRNFRPVPQDRTLFEILHDRGYPVAYVVEKCAVGSNTGNMCLGEINGKKYPFFNINPILAFKSVADQDSSADQTEKCLEAIHAVGDGGFVFCHYRRPDLDGHKFGSESARYLEDLLDLDVELGRLLAIDARVVVVSDHGFEMPSDPDDAPLQYRDVGIGAKAAYGLQHWHAERAIVVGADGVTNGREIGPYILGLLP